MNVPVRERALKHWLQQRRAYWQDTQQQFEHLRRQRHHTSESVSTLTRQYRRLAKDLAMARSLLPKSGITRFLEALVFDMHEFLHQPARHPLLELRTLVFQDVPRLIAQIRLRIALTTAWFFVAAAAGWLAVQLEPELAALFASEDMINRVQRGELWTDGLLNVVPSSLLSAQIMANNITVTLTAFSLGAFFGLGTLYIIGLNGLMLGGVLSYTAQFDLDLRLLEFIAAHGPVEISVILLAGAAGYQLGEALIRPGTVSRVTAFRNAVYDMGKIIIVCALFLVGAGIIEGHVSPSDQTFATKAAIGLTYWLIFLLYCSGRLRPRSHRARPL